MSLNTTRRAVRLQARADNYRRNYSAQKAELFGKSPVIKGSLTAGKYKKRMGSLMDKPPKTKVKEQEENIKKMLGLGVSSKYTGKPLTPSQRLSQKISLLMKAFKARQKQLMEGEIT